MGGIYSVILSTRGLAPPTHLLTLSQKYIYYFESSVLSKLKPLKRSGATIIKLSLKLSLNIENYTRELNKPSPALSKIQWNITVWLNKKGIMQELVHGPLSARTPMYCITPHPENYIETRL